MAGLTATWRDACWRKTPEAIHHVSADSGRQRLNHGHRTLCKREGGTMRHNKKKRRRSRRRECVCGTRSRKTATNGGRRRERAQCCRQGAFSSRRKCVGRRPLKDVTRRMRSEEKPPLELIDDTFFH